MSYNLSDSSGIGSLSNAGSERLAGPRLIAFFLTQFHPTPENDAWWGKGFTEWTNVTKARPLFNGHYQPHLPTDLGFYDLRLAETRRAQIELAKQYGIDGFCYHYYWFSGKRILNAPLDAMLADPAGHDMPFCLCWANENWTRRWDAADHEILIAQKYRPEDDLEFVKGLIPYFQDVRYIRLDGRPVLVVYRPQHLIDAKRTLSVWRAYCTEIGLPNPYLVAALTHGNENYDQYGFDAGVEFPPHNLKSPNINHTIRFGEQFFGNVMLYHEVAKSYLDRRYESPSANVFRTVFPSWDNTARTGSRAVVHVNGTPENFEYWLSESIRRTRNDYPSEDRLIFVNAWNEWAEGCHIEPDRRYGRAFLEATLRAISGTSRLTDFPDKQLPVEAEIVPRGFWADIGWVISCHFSVFIARLKLRINRYPMLRGAALLVLYVFRKVKARI